jgi:high affinity Mn2+ porin
MMGRVIGTLTAATVVGLCLAAPVRAQDSTAPAWLPQVLGLQLTVIGQWLPPFHSRYAGPKSLTGDGDQAVSDTYGLYLGSRLPASLGAYLDLEMARGKGISGVTGLGGLTNGDVIRQGSADLGTGPYIARAFLRYTLRLGHDSTWVDRAQDQLPRWGSWPPHRNRRRQARGPLTSST